MGRRARHGHARRNATRRRTVEYCTWQMIRQRCENPRCHIYKNYGARGINVCDRWQTFENFLADMGERPSSNHSIDRFPDKNGNYEPGNCRWATQKEQTRNKNTNVILEFDGVKMPVSAWAEKAKLNVSTLRVRLKRGWTVKRALLTSAAPNRFRGCHVGT